MPSAAGPIPAPRASIERVPVCHAHRNRIMAACEDCRGALRHRLAVGG